jgi:hypothetical protein
MLSRLYKTLLLLMFLTGISYAANEPVHAILVRNGSPAKRPSLAFVLENCVNPINISTNQSAPTVAYVQSTIGGVPGEVSGNVLGNDQITCSGSTVSYYNVQASDGAVSLWKVNYAVTGASWDYATAVPLNAPPQATAIRDVSFALDFPTLLDTGLLQHKIGVPANITRISCTTDIGTVSINLDVRAEVSPNTPGTLVLTSPLVCAANTTVSTATFVNPSVPANAPVALVVTGISGGSGIVRVHVNFSTSTH